MSSLTQPTAHKYGSQQAGTREHCSPARQFHSSIQLLQRLSAGAQDLQFSGAMLRVQQHRPWKLPLSKSACQPSLTSEPHEKLPESRRRALNLKLPPLTRTRLTVTLLDSFVMAGWRPSSYLHGGSQLSSERQQCRLSQLIAGLLLPSGEWPYSCPSRQPEYLPVSCLLTKQSYLRSQCRLQTSRQNRQGTMQPLLVADCRQGLLLLATTGP